MKTKVYLVAVSRKGAFLSLQESIPGFQSRGYIRIFPLQFVGLILGFMLNLAAISLVKADIVTRDYGIFITNCVTGVSISPATAGPFSVCIGGSQPLISAAITTENGSGPATIDYQWYKHTINSNSGGTPIESVISGTTSDFPFELNPNAIDVSTPGTTYYYLVVSNTDANCLGSSYTTGTVAVTVAAEPTTSFAGPDQVGITTCGLTTVTLAGNTPVIGTGQWSVVSGVGGSFANENSPSTTFSGTAGESYTLRWTISNAPCTASTDDVVITFNQNPTTSNAGADQVGLATCGLTTVTLDGNIPTIGTGQWSVVSGVGGSFANENSPSTTFTGTAGASYTLRWTISNAPCAASTDDVLITFNQNPTTSNAGADQVGITTCGLTTVTLAGNTPVIGTGQWSVVSGVGGSFANENSPSTTFSGTAGESYTLRWTISNAPCTASTDDVVITFNQDPTTSNAGADQVGIITCGLTTVTLAGNTPTIGTGQWSVVSGVGGSFANANSPATTFSGTAGASYTLRWTISNAPCAASTDDVLITFNQNPTPSNAGPDQVGLATCGLTTVTLAGNTPTVGTGQWSVVSGAGGSFANANSPATTFSGTAGASYTLRWTISNAPCAASTDDVLITFNQNPTTSNAGADQTGSSTCGLTTVTLDGNIPTIGTGQWSVVSGVGGSFANENSPATTFSGTAGASYTLRWTISNTPCAASMDDVDITFNQNPTPSNAGPDQVGLATCGLTTVTLAGNTPTVGTGQWSVVSGAGGSFANENSPTTTFSGTAGVSYTLRWTISNAPCAASTDDVLITFNQIPTASDAGLDQSICANGAATLASNVPSVGTGAWTIVSGPNTSSTQLSSTTANNATFTPTMVGSYILRWTITNGVCAVSSDDVAITVNPLPTLADAIQLAAICAGGGAQISLTGLLANSTSTVHYTINGVAQPAITGLVANGSGVATFTTSILTEANNGQTLRITQITNENTTCSRAFSEDVILQVNPVLTPSVTISAVPAGAICTGTNVNFTASPTNGGLTPAYQWKLNGTDIGTGATYVSNSLANGDKISVVLTSNAVCASPSTATSNEIVMVVNQPPTVSIAGPDQAVCAITATLAGNIPITGTGEWTLVGGSGTITDNGSPTSGLTALGIGTNTFRWTISNGACPPSMDEVVITRSQVPTTANAGSDQAVCATTITLAGNSPSVGTGVWTLISGSGTITNANSPTSGITSLGVGNNTFRWTISNGSCTPSWDEVTITRSETPTTSAAGADQAVCATTATLAGNTPVVGVGVWTVISGSGILSDANSSTSGITGLGVGSNTFRWTISNGSCTSVWDEVTIVRSDIPSAPDAGPDQAICATSVTLAGNAPMVGSGTWTLVGGSGTIANPGSPTSGVSNLGVGVNTFRWTISNGSCTAVWDEVVITRSATPTTSSAGTDQVVCASTATLGGNTPVVGSGSWTVVSGSGTITAPGSPSSGITGLGVGANTFRWTISNGSCTDSWDEVTITRNDFPTTSVAGPDQAFCSTTTATLAANTPTAGTGVWTLVSGSGTITTPTNPGSGVTGLGIGNNTFRWTISNGNCTASMDDVVISVSATPTIAAAGPDQSVCAITTTLAGNTAVAGTGTWTLVSGTGSITNPNSPYSGITGLGAGANTFRWTITNDPCASNFDEVTITRFTSAPATPGVITSASSTAICPVASGLVYSIAEVPNATNYTWSVPSGWTINTGQGIVSISATAGLQSTGIKTIAVTASNACGTSSASSISVSIGEFAYANAGPDQTVCTGTSSITLEGSIGGAIKQNNEWDWSSSISGGTFSGGGNSLTGTYTIPVSHRSGGTFTITLSTVDPAGSCEAASDYMIVTVLPAPTATIAITGPNPICAGSSSTITFTATPNTIVTYNTNQTINIDGSGTATLNTGILNTNTTYTLNRVAFPSSLSCSTAYTSVSVTVTVDPVAR
jgi:hypothetical protein